MRDLVRRFVRFYSEAPAGGGESAEDFKARVLGSVAAGPGGGAVDDIFGVTPTADSAEKAQRAAERAARQQTGQTTQNGEAPPADAGEAAAPDGGAGETPAPDPNAAQPPASGDGAGATGGETVQSPKEVTRSKLLEKFGVRKAVPPGAIDLGKLQTMPTTERDKIQQALNDSFELDGAGNYRLKPAAAARALAAQRGQKDQVAAVPPPRVDERTIWLEERDKERKYLETLFEPEQIDEAMRSQVVQERIKAAATARIGQAKQAKHQENLKAYGEEKSRADDAVEAFYTRHPDAREGDLGAEIDAFFAPMPEPIVVGLINSGYLDLDRIYELASAKLNLSRAIDEAFEAGQANPKADLRTGGAPASDTRGKPRGSQAPQFTSDQETKSSIVSAGQLTPFESLLK